MRKLGVPNNSNQTSQSQHQRPDGECFNGRMSAQRQYRIRRSLTVSQRSEVQCEDISMRMMVTLWYGTTRLPAFCLHSLADPKFRMSDRVTNVKRGQTLGNWKIVWVYEVQW